MTLVAKIKGFSRTKAEEFISHILPDKEERENFFKQIDVRKISEMEKIPLIIQALALLYHQNKQLPSTYTLTYDDLVLYLQNAYRSKFLDEKLMKQEEIQEALKEIAELAFRGLTREDRQLVFSRDEIKNENVFKLGLLSGEKAGSGFRPTILQFLHKTVQEHSASDHVVKRLLSDDRGPWEILVEQFHKDVSIKAQELPDRKGRKGKSTTHDATDELSSNDKVASALKTIVRTALSRSSVEEAMDLCHKLVEAGAFDDYIDFTRVSDVLTSHPISNGVLNSDEKTALVNYLVKDLLMETPKEWRAHEKSWLQTLLKASKRDPNEFKKYLIDQKKVLEWLAHNPETAKQALLQLSRFFKIFHSNPGLETEHPYGQPYQYILERVEYNKTLFRFIIGKLADHPALRDVILQEMAVLVLQHSFDANNGGVVPVNEMLSLVWDLKHESLPDHNIDQSEDPFLINPVLVHLRSTMKFSTLENLEHDTPCALKVLGTEADIPEFLPKVITDIRHLRNIHIVELENIDQLDPDLSSTYHEFATILYQSPRLVSVELTSLDRKLTAILTQNLPSSVQRLSVATVPARRTLPGMYTFPAEVSLVTLHLQNCLSKVEGLFKNTAFPNLKKIYINNDSHGWEGKEPLTWTREDVQSLLDAVRSGRMPMLGELSIWGCCLKGCGSELIEILKAESFHSAEFVGAEVSKEDGQIFLSNIEDGYLNHMDYLNLLGNEEIGSLIKHLKISCKQREISLEISPELKETGSDVTNPYGFIKKQLGEEAASQVASLMSCFTPEQKHKMRVLLSNLTSEQMVSRIRHLVRMLLNMYNSTSPDLPQEMKENMTKDPLLDIASCKYSLPPELGVMIALISSISKEQAQNLRNQISSIGPEQIQRWVTISPSFPFDPEVGFDLDNAQTSVPAAPNPPCCTLSDPLQQFTPLTNLSPMGSAYQSRPNKAIDYLSTTKGILHGTFPVDGNLVSTQVQNIPSATHQVYSPAQHSTTDPNRNYPRHHKDRQARTEKTDGNVALQFLNVTADILSSQAQSKVRPVDTATIEPESTTVTPWRSDETISSELERIWWRIPSLQNISQGTNFLKIFGTYVLVGLLIPVFGTSGDLEKIVFSP